VADSNVVEIKFGADVSGLRSGAKEATANIDGLIAALKELTATMQHHSSSGARPAAQEVDNLRDKMLGMKAEATQTGRAARFFANDIAAMVPVAGDAKGAIQDLFAIMLSGGAIGVAIGSVKLLVEGFKLLGEESRKAKEDFEKFVEDSKKQTEQLKVSVEKMLLTMQGATRAQLLAFDQTHDARERETKILKDLAAAELDLTTAKAAELGVGELGFAFSAIDAAARERQITALREQLKVIQDIIAAKKADIAPLGTADAAVAAREIALAVSVAAAERAAEQATVDADINLQRIKTEQETADKREKIELARITRVHEAEAAANVAIQKLNEDQLKQRIEQDKLLQAADLKQAEARKQIAKDFVLPIEHAFASAVRSMIVSGKDFTEAMKDMMLGLVDAVISGFLKMAGQAIITAIAGKAIDSMKAVAEVTHNAGIAGSAAAAATAGIPFAGPFLAIEAGLAMAAAVEAAFQPMAIAARGADLPSGGPFPTLLHSREMVLPAELADVVRGGGGGGGDVHAHFHISGPIDGDSFRRFVESQYFRRAMREARRNGLL